MAEAPSTPRKPPIVDLPLPQEMKDEIFGYLLHPDTITYTPEIGHTAGSRGRAERGSRADVYAFQTQIFAVNSTIGSQALKYFEKHNQFVLVMVNGSSESYQVFHDFDIPVVAENVNTTKKHAFAIKIHWHGRRTRAMASSWNCMIHIRDLPRLCELLRFRCQCAIPEGVVGISSKKDEPLLVEVAKPRTSGDWLMPTIEVQCQVGTPRKQQTSFLKNLHGAVGSGHRMYFKGFSDTMLVRATSVKLCTTVVWPRALDWDRFDSIVVLKHRADALVICGQEAAALRRYDSIRRHLRLSISMMSRDFSAPSPLYHRHLLLTCEVYLTQFWLQMRAQSFSDDDWHTPSTRNLPTEVSHAMSHVHLMSYILSFTRHPSASRCLNDLKLSLSLFSQTALGDEHIALDVSMLQEAVTEFEANRTKPFTVPWERMSFRTFPARIFDFYGKDIPADQQRPDGLEDLQDKIHLAALSEEEKNIIRTQLLDYGLSADTFA